MVIDIEQIIQGQLPERAVKIKSDFLFVSQARRKRKMLTDFKSKSWSLKLRPSAHEGALASYSRAAARISSQTIS